MVTTKTAFGNIKPIQIVEEMQNSYLDYAMSVIVSRALPDVRDGLKPVQRRILYAMHELGMRPGTAYKKSARLVGEVLGKYHPHGDSAVYDAMVRMAQPWSLRMPLVDGQGNFGSVDGDPPAALRYTEARLAAVAEEMLANLDQDTVDFKDNFDGSLQEPVVLPARLPNLLINGASGIAVGMATNIPPHNPSEICDAIVHLVDRPDMTIEQLMRYVKGPDFPTGATIMGREGIKNTYMTGRGQIIVRARAEIEETARSNRMQIIVSELPYQVNKSSLVEKIAHLAKDKRIDGISEIRDESDRDGMRIVIELRAGVQPMVVRNNLYKLTAMQSSFSANMLALIDGMPRVITLKVALQQFILFRQSVIRRRIEYELRRARDRAHILAGLRIAISNMDEVIRLIRASESAEAARGQLMTRFGLDERQSQAILDMQLRRLAALERERLENEYQELQKSIQGMEELLADDGKVLAEVKQETDEIKKKYGQPRRTDINADPHDLSRQELEAHEQIVVTLSQSGYIKRIAASTYRNQHRGGKGVVSMNKRDDDAVKHILVVDTHHKLLFFTNKGRVLSLTAYELRADMSRNTRGVPVVNVLAITDTEKISKVIALSNEELEHDDNRYLVLTTRSGRIKRVVLSSVSNIRPSGLIIMNLKPEDELVSVRLADQEDDVIIVTEQGMSIRFPVTEVPLRQRAAGGVKGMTLRGKDRVISMDVGTPDTRLLVISKLGYGKLTPLDSYRTQGRGGIGVKTFKIRTKTGVVADAQIIDDSKEVYVVSEQAQVLRTNLSEIRSMGRATQGVTIFKPAPGDFVASIEAVSNLNLDEDEDGKSNDEAKNKASTNGKAKNNGRRDDAQQKLDGIE
ncbi:MAG: DNA gyrase subunit A [Chloroflexi bacterium]|nr:DNA gyrase subunit A [Chloroflexota bacterium]